jgi:hypothetical protein
MLYGIMHSILSYAFYTDFYTQCGILYSTRNCVSLKELCILRGILHSTGASLFYKESCNMQGLIHYSRIFYSTCGLHVLYGIVNSTRGCTPCMGPVSYTGYSAIYMRLLHSLGNLWSSRNYVWYRELYVLFCFYSVQSSQAGDSTLHREFCIAHELPQCTGYSTLYRGFSIRQWIQHYLWELYILQGILQHTRTSWGSVPYKDSYIEYGICLLCIELSMQHGIPYFVMALYSRARTDFGTASGARCHMQGMQTPPPPNHHHHHPCTQRLTHTPLPPPPFPRRVLT